MFFFRAFALAFVVFGPLNVGAAEVDQGRKVARKTFSPSDELGMKSFPFNEMSRQHVLATEVDPCAKVAGKNFTTPADALACLKSFPFNEMIRQNVLETVSRVFDFYTFEDYYLNIAEPFEESTTDIRAELRRINSTHYATDYDFSRDLYNVVNQLNDGHTLWVPHCYWAAWESILPAPPVTVEVDGVQGVYVAPDAVPYLEQLGPGFISYFDDLHFDWRRLAGARVLTINGLHAYEYADRIASNTSGNYLDHGVRINSVFSSYRISGNAYSQRLGDIAAQLFPEQDSLTVSLIPVNCTQEETINIPFVATFHANSFTNSASYWANNCAATNATNGVDLTAPAGVVNDILPRRRRRMRGDIIDASLKQSIGLPDPFQPRLPLISGQNGTVKSYILPDNITGVLFVGSFEDVEARFQKDVVAAMNVFKQRGVKQLIVDLTNNDGGFVCLGHWLRKFLAGSNNVQSPSFQSTSRANYLAQRILKNVIARNLSANISNYASNNWAAVNGTPFAHSFNYNDPPVPTTINGKSEPTSQRFLDICDSEFIEPFPVEPVIKLKNVVLVSNGNCASTCALFSTVMHEKYGTKTVVYGGKPGERMEYKGMAGNQVLEWVDLDTEIKTAGVKNDPYAPPDLLVNANMRVNWRTAYSFLDEEQPIAFRSERATIRLPYTRETYNNPEKVWEQVAKKAF